MSGLVLFICAILIYRRQKRKAYALLLSGKKVEPVKDQRSGPIGFVSPEAYVARHADKMRKKLERKARNKKRMAAVNKAIQESNDRQTEKARKYQSSAKYRREAYEQRAEKVHILSWVIVIIMLIMFL